MPSSPLPARPLRRLAAWVAIALALSTGGCLVGPDYRPPEPPVAPEWAITDPSRIHTAAEAPIHWWHAFNDPALDALVELAYQQNLTLQAAGLRVLAAQARRGIAIGLLFPQLQEAAGSITRTRQSLNQPSLPEDPTVNPQTGQPTSFDQNFSVYNLGFDAAW